MMQDAIKKLHGRNELWRCIAITAFLLFPSKRSRERLLSQVHIPAIRKRRLIVIMPRAPVEWRLPSYQPEERFFRKHSRMESHTSVFPIPALIRDKPLDSACGRFLP